MLIPRFSLRWVLAVVGLCGVAFLFLSLAISGTQWAAVITAVLLTLVSAAFCHAVLFAVVWLLSLLVGGISPAPEEHSPFRSETPTDPPPGFAQPAVAAAVQGSAAGGGSSERTVRDSGPSEPTE